MVGFVWTINRNSKIIRLLLSKGCQFNTQLLKMQTGNLFVEMFRETINVDLIFIAVFPQVNLSEGLIGNELLITNEGCPVAHPKFTSLPSASK